MLEWLFGFRGVIGRARFLAGLSLLLFSAAIVAVVVALIAVAAHWPKTTWTGPTALAIFILGAWSIVALSTRRLRDMGVPPGLVLGGLALLGIAERLWSPLTPPGPWADAVHRPITALAGAAVGLALLIWPGRTPEGEIRSGGLGFLVPVGAVAALLVAAASLGLVFDPLQGRSCPVYGPGRPSDDCASQGVVGRLYAGQQVVRANRDLDRTEADRALQRLDRALAVRPQFVYAYNSRGLAYEQLNDQARALQAYDRALALQPGYVNGLINRAVLLDKLGRRDRALADLRAIQRHDPDNVTAKAGIAYMTGGGR